jgi:hypothetical protein
MVRCRSSVGESRIGYLSPFRCFFEQSIRFLFRNHSTRPSHVAASLQIDLEHYATSTIPIAAPPKPLPQSMCPIWRSCINKTSIFGVACEHFQQERTRCFSNLFSALQVSDRRRRTPSDVPVHHERLASGYATPKSW